MFFFVFWNIGGKNTTTEIYGMKNMRHNAVDVEGAVEKFKTHSKIKKSVEKQNRNERNLIQ